MNSDKPNRSDMRGNALIYILLALALLGGLTMLLADQGGESDDLSYEKSELVTTKTVAFVGSAKNVVDQMMMSGTNINSLSYLRPNQPSFDLGQNQNKVFHPEGGGLNLDSADPNLFTGIDAAPKPGWYMGRFNNIEWTHTLADDILFVAYDISEAVCHSINQKITGDPVIPIVTGATESFFVDSLYGGTANADFMVASCATCEGWPSLCVAGTGNVNFTYYNIISGQ